MAFIDEVKEMVKDLPADEQKTFMDLMMEIDKEEDEAGD